MPSDIGNFKLQEIMNKMKEIEYGWLDRNNIKHYEEYELFSNNYILQTSKEVLENKIGVCWDQVELERYYFKQNNINCMSYFIVEYDGKRMSNSYLYGY